MRLCFSDEKFSGKLITFCGLDGCGKTTMIKMLENRLRLLGYNFYTTFQPTKMMRQSEIFRNYMDCENHDPYSYLSLSLQAAADRIQHCEKDILPRLKLSEIVISDRYFYSCLANLRARGYKDSLWIYDVAKYIPKPDLAFFLEITVDKAIERVRKRPDEKDKYIDIDLQYRLFDEYKFVRSISENTVLVNTDQTPEKTFSTIWDNVLKILTNNKLMSVGC